MIDLIFLPPVFKAERGCGGSADPRTATGIHCQSKGRAPNHQSTCSNIETRMDRPRSVEPVIRVIS